MLGIKEIVKLILLNNYIYIYEIVPILIGLYKCMQNKKIKNNNKQMKLNIVPSLN